MKVYNIGQSEEGLIMSGLEYVEEANELAQKDELDKDVQQACEYDAAHARTTMTLMRDQRLQELCERCLSYFWDEYQLTGDFGELADDMGLEDEELVELFHEAGYEEE